MTRLSGRNRGRINGVAALALLGAFALFEGLAGCGPIGRSAPASDSADSSEDLVIDAIERRVDESIARVRESAVALEFAALDTRSGTRRVATGVVVSPQGDVLSVRVDPPPADAPIVASDARGGRHLARWIASDPETGLTLLRVDPQVARPVRPARRAPRLGSQVLVIGNPFGLGHSVTRGQVSGLERRVDVGPRPLGGLIQVDASLHPGDNGALLANLRGEWLGLIRSGIAAPNGGQTTDHDLGFAIAAQDALWIADQLRNKLRVDRAYLGLRLAPDPLGAPPGAVLAGVLASTPAARAGLKRGDRVVALDGRAIESAGDLTDQLDRTLANAEATLDYFRDNRRERVAVRTESRPALALTQVTRTVSKTDDAPPTPPRELLDRIDRLEKRLQEMEKRGTAQARK